MAQKTEKEETEFKVVPETITPCINNCGVTGNQATNNMCQKCFNATTTGSSGAGTSSVCGGNSMIRDKSPRSSSPRSSLALRSSDPAETSGDLKKEKEELKEESMASKRTVNRCSGCRRKVGLTGFRCRCGDLFCAEHRYSDRHDCSYDYKSAGRDAIARENPVVKAAKIVKI